MNYKYTRIYSLPDVNRLDVAAEGALGQIGLPADLAGMQLHSGVALRSISHLRRCHDYHKALFNRAFKSHWVLDICQSLLKHLKALSVIVKGSSFQLEESIAS